MAAGKFSSILHANIACGTATFRFDLYVSMNCCRFFRRSRTTAVTPAASKEENLIESAGGGCEHSDQTQNKSDNDISPHQLPYTTVDFKVALDQCEGCKRKVVKALCTLQGVKKIDISTKLQKVAVSGYVDPWKVLKKIEETGKKVESWSAREEHKAESEPEREQRENSLKMLDCPVEPLAAIEEQQSPPVKMPSFCKKLKFKSYVELDAEYQDPKYYEQQKLRYPSGISSFYDLPGLKADRDTASKRPGEYYFDVDKSSHTSEFERSTRRRSSNPLTPGWPGSYSHVNLDSCMAYETHLSPAAARNDKARNSESYGSDYNDKKPGKISLLLPETKNVLNTVTEESCFSSDDESEEVFALVKNKSGLRLVPVIDFSAKPRKSRVDHRNYPTFVMRKQGRDIKQPGRSTTPCRFCAA